jgi:acetyltransferase-like isoleucine patch superfamily enzyme
MIKYLIAKFIKKIQLPAINGTDMHTTAKVCSGSQVVESKIGKYSYVGNYCTVINVDIGSFCSIADYNIIGGSSHPLEWVSSSPVFYSGSNVMNKNFTNKNYTTSIKTCIGNDVWIGSGCIIKSGVSIGNGAVLGMGSVLTKDVGDYEIWAGNPAKMIRKRFDDETINRLLNIKWWDYSDEQLMGKADLMDDIHGFINSYNV